MISLSQVEKTLMKRVLLLILGVGMIGFLIPSLQWPFVKGLLFGGIFTLLRIRLMMLTFSKGINKHKDAVPVYTMLHYGLRYLLTAVILYIALKDRSMNILGTILGILLLKPAALLDTVFSTPSERHQGNL